MQFRSRRLGPRRLGLPSGPLSLSESWVCACSCPQAFLLSALVSDGAWQCSCWPLGPAGQGGSGWGVCVCDTSGVAFSTTRCQCLPGFRLPGAFTGKNNLHHRLAGSLGMSDPVGGCCPTHIPAPHPAQACSAGCPSALSYKDGVLGDSREQSGLHLSLSSQLNAWSGFGLTTHPQVSSARCSEYPHPRGMASPGPPGRLPPAASSLC